MLELLLFSRSEHKPVLLRRQNKMSQLNFQPLADSLSQKRLAFSFRTPQRESASHVLSHFSGHTLQRHLSSRVSPVTTLVAAGHHYTVARGCHLAFTTLLTCHVTQAFVTCWFSRFAGH